MLLVAFFALRSGPSQVLYLQRSGKSNNSARGLAAMFPTAESLSFQAGWLERDRRARFLYRQRLSQLHRRPATNLTVRSDAVSQKPYRQERDPETGSDFFGTAYYGPAYFVYAHFA
jgi:hypothetical protein